MIIFQIILLSFIQGITEFLPISSSGHLVLTHALFGSGDDFYFSDINQKHLDIAVHLGTLFAVMIYFRHDVVTLAKGFMDVIKGRFDSTNAFMFCLLVIASIPVVLFGFILFTINLTIFDSVELIAWTTIIFALALFFADKRPETITSVNQFSITHALLYGFAQCIALIPGVSRSGITMTAGRFLGHSRIESARFSMLMGMVAISGAGLLSSVSLATDETVSIDFMGLLFMACMISFLQPI